MCFSLNNSLLLFVRDELELLVFHIYVNTLSLNGDVEKTKVNMDTTRILLNRLVQFSLGTCLLLCV